MTSKRACDSCGTSHTKCDGGNPCRRCTLKQIDCKYDRLVGKKGLEKGKITQLEKTVESLHEELETERRIAEDLSLQLAVQEIPTCTSSIYDEYVQIYKSVLLPVNGIPPLKISASQFWNGEVAKPSLILMGSLLAHTAQSVGNMDHAIAFHNHAYQQMKDYYTETNPYLAVSHLSFCNWFLKQGDFERVNSHIHLGINKCLRLLNQEIFMSNPSVAMIIHGAYIGCLVAASVASDPSSKESIMQLERAEQYVKSINFNGMDLQPTLNVRKLLDLVCSGPITSAEIEPIFDEMLRFTSFSDSLQSLVYSLKAVVHFWNAENTEAVHCCDMCFAKICNETFLDPTAIGAYNTLAQVYYYTGHLDKVSAILVRLNGGYTHCFPVAHRIVAWIQDPSKRASVAPFLNLLSPFKHPDAEESDPFPSPASLITMHTENGESQTIEDQILNQLEQNNNYLDIDYNDDINSDLLALMYQ